MNLFQVVKMNNINTQSEKLVDFIRDGLIETEHYGYVVRCSKNHIAEKIGDDKNYPFYLRSCAKPLQASSISLFTVSKGRANKLLIFQNSL